MKQFLWVIAMLLGMPLLATAQRPKATPAPSARITVVRSNAGHLALSPDGKTLAYEAPGGSERYRDIFTVPMDEPTSAPVCLTCSHPALPGKHAGRPAWHPGGRYLAFQAEKKSVPVDLDRRCIPSSGLLNDIYVMDTETKAAWLMVRLPLNLIRDIPGVLAPRFSPDGTKLVWAQRIRSSGPRQGTWEIRYGKFELGKGGPALAEIKTLPVDAVPAFYEPEGFDPSGRTLFFSSSLNKSMEAFTIGMDGGKPEALTANPRTWDFHPTPSPDGKLVAWASSQGLRYQPDPFEVEADFWVMRADGTGKRRLTNFHKGPEAALIAGPNRIASDIAWTPDSKAIIGLVVTEKPGTVDMDLGTLVRVRVE